MTGIIASQSLLFSQDDDETDSWVTVFDADAQGVLVAGGYTIVTGGTNGRNWRQLLATDFPRAGIGLMRVTFQAASDGGGDGLDILSAAVGYYAGSGAYDYQDGTQVALTFDGGNAGFTIGVGETKVSDPVAFTFSDTQNLVFAAFAATDPPVTSRFAGWTLSTNNGFLQTVGDFSIDTTLTADVTLGLLASGVVTGIKKIEVSP